MDLLLLGGTAFLGRAIASAAMDRGIAITCLARGTRSAIDGVTLIRADRDEDDALTAVADWSWDSVIDLTSQPGHARRAVRDLNASHWVFVSSANVHTRGDVREQDEHAPTHEPLAGDVMEEMSQYGPAKVACENAIRENCESFTIVRAGLIGGAGDASARSGYYPWRFANPTGPDVLVPPDLDAPVALIDVEDLASWIVDCAQQRVHGIFNATGPTTTLGEVLDTARTVANSQAVIRPVPEEALAAERVSAWMAPASLPIWIDDPTLRWFSTLDTTAARAHGLHTRPLSTTLAAALAYEQTREQRPTGLTDEQEHRLRDRLNDS